MSFWGELKRRNVVKVAVAYLIVAWLIVQIANTFFPLLHLPDWAVTLVAVLVILGFPLALLFAWAFELTPDGLKKTEHVPLEESITHLTGQKLNYILIGVIVLGVAYLLFDNFYLDKLAIQTEVESRVAELAPPAAGEEEETQKTIAVMPFVNLSSDPEQEYFVDGLTEELLNSLAQIPDLKVTGRTSSFSFKGSDKTVQEIAGVLGVEYILEGSVRKAGNDLRITAQLLRGEDGFHLWSETFDRELKDIFALQEDVATAVADELKVTLGVGEIFKQLGGTDNEQAYELYLMSKALYREGPPKSPETVELIEETIALDPQFALAWALKSNIYCGLIDFIPKDQRSSVFDTALDAAQKAIELEPNLAAGYQSLGTVKMYMGEWIESETAFRKAIDRVSEPSLRYEVMHPFLYEHVGDLEKAKKVFEGQFRNDPLNANKLNLYIYFLGLLGDRQGAEEEYERAMALFGERWPFGDQNISYARLYSSDTVFRDEIPYSSPAFDVVKDHLESPEEAITQLRLLYRNSDNIDEYEIETISAWAAYFDDSEFALDALSKAISLESSFLYYIWAPVMKEVRQTPRFKKFIREIGLVDYWEQFGWPDICRPLDNGDFVCD